MAVLAMRSTAPEPSWTLLKSKLDIFGYTKRHRVVHVNGGSYVAMATTTDIASGNAVVDG
jgi:hypothetical protein